MRRNNEPNQIGQVATCPYRTIPLLQRANNHFPIPEHLTTTPPWGGEKPNKDNPPYPPLSGGQEKAKPLYPAGAIALAGAHRLFLPP